VTELHSKSLLEARAGLEGGDFSSVELSKDLFERIKKVDPLIKSYLHIAEKEAIAQAKLADDGRSKANNERVSLPPLHGLPLAVKDVLAVKDMPATAGSRMLEKFIPTYNATVVSRLKKAGMHILGKTNTDEFAMGSSTENSAYAASHNPWDLERVPGGSSGGSAAAVAAGLAPVALGTDTGGSVRQPASFCGLTGLKPSYSRSSRYGLIAFGSSLDVVGVLGRSVEDIVPVFSAMAGYDEKDASSSSQAVPEIELSETYTLKGKKVGVPKEYFIEGLHADVEEAVKKAIDQLQSLGAELIDISLPHTEYALPVYYIIGPAEASANLARFDGVRYGIRYEESDLIQMFKKTRGSGFGPEVKRRIMIGTHVLSTGYYDAFYGQAQRVRQLIRQDFEDAFKKVDLIAAPSTPTTAFKIGQHSSDPLDMYLQDVFTLPASLAGVPGISLPVGFDSQKIPIGMQLFAPYFEEEELLRSAYLYQSNTEWHLRRPEL
jgi:aspartyl-tRNA(Asn)/glutamyl-tRNA(Gln) amidotransferase subunit A